MTTRYAVTLGDNGMVIGDGSTREEALADAEQAEGGDAALPLAVVEEYDSATHETRMSGGIVCICRRPVD